MTYDEAAEVLAGLMIEYPKAGVFPRASAFVFLDAIGFRQMQERIEVVQAVNDSFAGQVQKAQEEVATERRHRKRIEHERNAARMLADEAKWLDENRHDGSGMYPVDRDEEAEWMRRYVAWLAAYEARDWK